MPTISLRLSEKDERDLKAIQRATGMSKSEAIRDAIKTRRALIDKEKGTKGSAFKIYSEIMAASEGEPWGPETDDASHVRERVRAIVQAKHDRRSSRR